MRLMIFGSRRQWNKYRGLIYLDDFGNGNGTGPMDVVTPEAVPAPAKPARTPRRRVRRPAPEAKAEPKAEAKITDTPDMGGETTA